jgi:hypothetical protein
MICPTAKAEYFSMGGLDRANHVEVTSKNRVLAQAEQLRGEEEDAALFYQQNGTTSISMSHKLAPTGLVATV